MTRRTGHIPFAAGAAALLLLALAACGGSKHAPRHGRRLAPSNGPDVAHVSIRANAPTMVIPRSFFGLSTEYWTLPVDERHVAVYGRVISLLHVPGDGPFILRIGGDSSDHTFYDPRVLRIPRWVFDLTHPFIERTVHVVRELHLRVILDLNLITATPDRATAWVAEAQRVMPPGSIIGYEIGNEPDLYSREFWLLATEADRFGGRILPNDITADSYASDYNAYAQLIVRIAPRAALFAPALANPHADLDWMRTLLDGAHPSLRVLTGHRYPYSACAFPGSPLYPTIDQVLSEDATVGMARSVGPMVALARSVHLPARLTEINSVTCGGLTGVSDTFATALWAPDALFELAREGLQGVNLHARQFSINDPFSFTFHGVQAHPLLYGMILFSRMLGPGARLVPLRLHAAATLRVKAWAVRVAGNTLHVLLLDKGPRPATIRLSLPTSSPATMQRLLAPSVTARSGETLGGQSLNEQGLWRGRPRTTVVAPRAGIYTVTTPAYSAAMLSVPLGAASRGQRGPAVTSTHTRPAPTRLRRPARASRRRAHARVRHAVRLRRTGPHRAHRHR